MPVSVDDFWKLLIESGLADAVQGRQWWDDFVRSTDSAGAQDAQRLADFLVQKQVLTPYQAKVISAGRAGPFFYGDFKTLERIESGRFKGMFRAVHLPTGHPVLLSFLSGPLLKDSAIVGHLAYRALQTSGAAAQNPALARCYGLHDLGQYKLFILEDVQGRPLSEVLATNGPLPPDAACRIAQQIAQGLKTLEATRQHHGELRPENVVLTPHGGARLLHFPWSRDPLPATDKKPELPLEAFYAAPELSEPGGRPTFQSDVYALGCLLYELLTGQRPYSEGSLTELRIAHASKAPRPVEKVNPSVPNNVAMLVARLMAKKPESRYQRSDDLLKVLSSYKEEPVAGNGHFFPTLAPFEQAMQAMFPQQVGDIAPMPVGAVPAGVPVQPTFGPLSAPLGSVAPVTGIVPMPPRPAEAPASVPAAAQTAPSPVAASPTANSPVAAGPIAAKSAARPAPKMVLDSGRHAAPLKVKLDEPGTPAAHSTAARRARQAKARSQQMMMYGALAVAAAVIGIFVFVFNRSDNPAPVPPPDVPSPVDHGTTTSNVGGEDSTPPVDTDETPVAAGDGSNPSAESIASDEPALRGVDEELWAGPPKANPVDLRFAPAGARVVLAVRVAELLAEPAAEGLLDDRTSGQLSVWLKEALPRVSGVAAEEIDLALLSLLEGSGDAPIPALVIHLKKPADKDALLAAWGNPEPAGEGDEHWQTADWGYWLPSQRSGKTIVIAPVSEMQAIVELKGKAPPLSREAERLWAASDEQRHVNLLLLQSSIWSQDTDLFSGAGGQLRDLAVQFLEQTTESQTFAVPKATYFGLQLTDDRLFVEVRLTSPADQAEAVVAREYVDRIRQLPNSVNSYLDTLAPSPYSTKVLRRLPQWVEIFSRYTRGGYTKGVVVLRSYLPQNALGNLALAAHLAVLEPTGVAVAVTPQQQTPTENLTVAQRLQQRISLSFDRNTLEKCMELLSDEIGVPIEILGSDLQLEGITKNQSFGLDERDKPAIEILLSVLLKANPAGKLVFVIKPKEANGPEMVFITTRAAVAQRGDTLPPELQQAPAGE